MYLDTESPCLKQLIEDDGHKFQEINDNLVFKYDRTLKIALVRPGDQLLAKKSKVWVRLEIGEVQHYSILVQYFTEPPKESSCTLPICYPGWCCSRPKEGVCRSSITKRKRWRGGRERRMGMASKLEEDKARYEALMRKEAGCGLDNKCSKQPE